MTEGAATDEGVDGTVVAYRERLHAPWYVWGLATFLTASLAVAYGFYLGDTAGLLTFAVSEALVAWWLVATAAVVVVDDRVLRAGRARLPLRYVGRIAPLDVAQSRDARGRLADPAAYLCTRGWISRSVLVEVDDERDPHPYWLVSSRHGHALAQALAPARDAAKAGAQPSEDPAVDG
ncbi:MAG TPA: DUF3093 domain-containing protein [Candidatus Nanopelagicales bacterium]|nr:DUF3093 domain-containing protein [Candidatus Nanopelagicales bacterium]